MPILILFFHVLLAFSIQERPVSQQPTSQYYVVIFSLGPQWDASKQANEQAGFREHSSNLQALRKKGSITLGARYSDKGMVVFKAEAIEEVKGYFAEDPMVKGGLFTMEVHPWYPFYKGCVE